MKITVLGLDPGTLKMGYGILTLNSNRIECLESSRILCPKKYNMGERLYHLNHKLSEVFKKYKPHHTAVERVFFGKNADSAFKLGQAFGMSLYQSHKWSCKVYEYSARTVKKSITGTGSASKESILFCIKNILNISPCSLDASDALALALCHIYWLKTQKAMQKNLSVQGVV